MADNKQCLVLPSTYRDSVILMKLSTMLNSQVGVLKAAVMMGTPQNKSLLREAELLTSDGEQAGKNDLLICVEAEDLDLVKKAMNEAKSHLSNLKTVTDGAGDLAPRTLETALQRLPEANIACISVPGQYAHREALKALQKGLHVFLFSDHVDLKAEEDLKNLAMNKGLLLMGPECGTAILNGVPLGFANQVPRGPVGVVSASGTGLQEVTSLLAQQGVGVSQAIGVGGRDLHKQIRGQSMRTVIRAFARDEDTEVIMLISKPPDIDVAGSLAKEAAKTKKPCIMLFLGSELELGSTNNLYSAATLEHAAFIARALAVGDPVPPNPPADLPDLSMTIDEIRAGLRHQQNTIHGLYCGGTLAYEALWLMRRSLQEEVVSNLDGTLNASQTGVHMVLDLGAEEFTQGRPHPMINPEMRSHKLMEICRRPEAAVVICDVILGWGSHTDPAMELVKAWKEAESSIKEQGRSMICIANVCGTHEDFQGYEQQCEVLRENGIILARTNAQAVRLAVTLVGDLLMGKFLQPPSERIMLSSEDNNGNRLEKASEQLSDLFTSVPRVINIGLELFSEQLNKCGVPFVHVDWRPPAGGNARLANLLDRLR